MIGELFAFALVMVIGQFSPGPDMLLLTRTALAEGRKAGWLMVLGIVTGLAFHATLAIGGMAVLLAHGGIISTVIHWLSATYLIWLAIGLIRKGPEAEEQEVSKRSPYLRGLFCNLLNPKVLVFFASVVAPFLSEGQPDWWPVALWLLIIGEGLFFWGLWVLVLQINQVRETYRRIGRFLDVLFAILLCALAINLLV